MWFPFQSWPPHMHNTRHLVITQVIICFVHCWICTLAILYRYLNALIVVLVFTHRTICVYVIHVYPLSRCKCIWYFISITVTETSIVSSSLCKVYMGFYFHYCHWNMNRVLGHNVCLSDNKENKIPYTLYIVMSVYVYYWVTAMLDNSHLLQPTQPWHISCGLTGVNVKGICALAQDILVSILYFANPS